MEISAASTGQHCHVRSGHHILLLHTGYRFDLGHLDIGLLGIGTVFTSESPKDVSSLIFATDLDQPTRGFGEEPNSREKDDQREDLEGNREPPPDGRGSTVDEG